jgi:uncharacterized protein YabN with tetrapyrrole methylase and pyrophosphatase domain
VIHVVGARALDSLTITSPVVARTRRVLETPHIRRDVILSHTYDDCFETSLASVLDDVQADLSRRASESDIVYLVPGAGTPGDATVRALDPALISARTSGIPDRPGFDFGLFLTVDALELALAEDQSPFDRGLVGIDPGIALVVTNWYGATVTELAGERLGRLYCMDRLPEPTADLELLIPPVESLTAAASVSELEHIVARLRRPDGCPWDRKQTRESLLPQFVAELDELAQAIHLKDTRNQAEELGDVLFHIVAQCQVAAEAGDFSLDDVLRGITAKLVRRHPHVFGDVVAESYDDVLTTWQRVKDEEKVAASALDAALDSDEGDLKEND